MKILVMASKDVGFACVQHLIDTFPDDQYDFIAHDPGADKISAYLKENGHDCSTDPVKALEVIGHQPETIYDWLLNLWGSVIYSLDVLSQARRSLNIHPSYLPYGRGRDPVVWAIRNNEPAGLAFHSIIKEIDEGPIWYREQVEYSLPCRGEDLYARIVGRCSEAFKEQWPALRETTSDPAPLDEGNYVTRRRKDLFADRDVSLDDEPNVRDFVLRLLAHDFGPGYTARLNIDGNMYDATLNLRPSSKES